MKPSTVRLSRQVGAAKAALLLAGLNVGRDVVLAPMEFGSDQGSLHRTIVIPTDVDTYYYARPLTHEPIFRSTDCRNCGQRVKVYKARWIFADTGESTPICDNCIYKGDY